MEWVCWPCKDSFWTTYPLVGNGCLERTDFYIFLFERVLWSCKADDAQSQLCKGIVVLTGLSSIIFTLGGCGGFQKGLIFDNFYFWRKWQS